MSASLSLEATSALPPLCALLRIPSVSAEPRHAGHVAECAGWLARHLRQIGLDAVQVTKTARHPVVTAEWHRAPGKPTLLIYGHYDVQPAETEDGWRSPPFQPTIADESLHARGASDDKGQLYCHIAAMDAHLRASGRLPVNVTCLFEGEEEIGSPNLPAFLDRWSGARSADVAVISDMAILGPDRPALTYALRGALNLELVVRGPGRDLHSGQFGGVVHNPVQVLSDILARLHSSDGRIAIPGFYGAVRPVSALERRYMAQVGPSDEAVRRAAGISRGWGEPGFTLHERRTIRPALTINGIRGGYGGPGTKSIIPQRAVAKIGIRLVPDQDPASIERLFRQWVASRVPPTVGASIRRFSASRPIVLDRFDPVMRAARHAYRQGFGREPVFLRSGGTIPVVDLLVNRLGIPTVLMGFGLPNDGAHAPNERIHLPTFARGIATASAFLSALGALARPVHLDASRPLRKMGSIGRRS